MTATICLIKHIQIEEPEKKQGIGWGHTHAGLLLRLASLLFCLFAGLCLVLFLCIFVYKTACCPTARNNA